MGWLMLLLLGVATAALMWRMGLARPVWTLAGAALMLGAAGYALQGRPTLAAAPRVADAQGMEVEPAIVELRGALFGRFTQEAAIMTASDALLRAGAQQGAVRVMLGSLNRYPRDFALWTGLGSALAAHDGGQVSPAALFAFRRAIQLAPEHPGPRFFLGLAYVRAGDYAAGRAQWRAALRFSEPGTGYRAEIALRLGLLERLIAATG
ncbi:tetratricopeptide repeat protein [Sphingomonas aracearum]|uniref:Uncharacterized protein n=1 Tax=Sphingomonas aracearum TaxID=2283317 RepID=A0A369VTH1_9SPHN|nr:hypothetical protein [Sphingomonas aracearum]RDE05139.1 hypothetical protein DVW87_07605 [Sphingomonas aracearum]